MSDTPENVEGVLDCIARDTVSAVKDLIRAIRRDGLDSKVTIYSGASDEVVEMCGGRKQGYLVRIQYSRCDTPETKEAWGRAPDDARRLFDTPACTDALRHPDGQREDSA